MMTFDAIGTELLKAYGYEVLECGSDEEAIEKAEDLKRKQAVSGSLFRVRYIRGESVRGVCDGFRRNGYGEVLFSV